MGRISNLSKEIASDIEAMVINTVINFVKGKINKTLINNDKFVGVIDYIQECHTIRVFDEELYYEDLIESFDDGWESAKRGLKLGCQNFSKIKDADVSAIETAAPDGHISYIVTIEKRWASNTISVPYKDGRIEACISGDSSYPGIYTYLVRKDGIQVDATYVEADPEMEGDIRIMVYGDPNSYESTSEIILEKEDILSKKE